MEIDSSVLINLVLTLVIEIIVLICFREKRVKVYIASLIMNVVTNVPLNIGLTYLKRYFSSLGYLPLLLLGEIIVFFIEWLIYYLVLKESKRSFFYSFYSNILSFLIGIILTSFIGGIIW